MYTAEYKLGYYWFWCGFKLEQSPYRMEDSPLANEFNRGYAHAEAGDTL